MQEIPKAIKRQMRELADRIYELAQTRELEKLDESFAAWKRGEIDCWDLSELIHKFHDGSSRNLYKMFVSNDEPTFKVAYGVNHGIVDLADVPADVRPYVDSLIQRP